MAAKANPTTEPRHSFHFYCTDWAAILDPDHMVRTKRRKSYFLERMQAEVIKQSKTTAAKRAVDFAHYKDYDDGETENALYFGLFVEWFAKHYLSYYGHAYNIEGVSMLEDEGNTAKDLGTDGEARSIKPQVLGNNRAAVKGSPVKIQVKGKRRKDKKHFMNDGSRIANFISDSATAAIHTGHAYQVRLVLFTTGAGVHYTLEENSHKMLEVINFNKIVKKAQGDILFLNYMRESVGLPPVPLNISDRDQEAQMLEFENAEKNEQLEAKKLARTELQKLIKSSTDESLRSTYTALLEKLDDELYTEV